MSVRMSITDRVLAAARLADVVQNLRTITVVCPVSTVVEGATEVQIEANGRRMPLFVGDSPLVTGLAEKLSSAVNTVIRERNCASKRRPWLSSSKARKRRT
jgi:2-phospho-L-lactate guanylyltransferase (CobY/MobA/RfbA family)